MQEPGNNKNECINKKMSKKLTSADTIHMYKKSYFLNQVDGFEEYESFTGMFSELFDRYQRNIELLGLDSSHSYLEFGCGRGEICIYHACNGGNAVGVDYSTDAIMLARNKAKSLNVEVEFHASSFVDFLVPESSFDRILASEFLEHISKEEAKIFLILAYRALKAGGKLLVFTHPNTLQRRFGYPLVRAISYFRGRKLPRQQPDTISEHYKMYHLNEQSYFSLLSLARSAGFSKIKVCYDELELKNISNLNKAIKLIIHKTFLRHIFLTNLYLVIEK